METPTTHIPFPSALALSTEKLAGFSSAPAAGDDTLPLQYIPGEPTVKLNPVQISAFLTTELATPVLDELYPRLWLVARKSDSNIEALHRHVIHGREIMVSEDPKMHLVWQHGRVYVKPIPMCLLNYDFWLRFLPPEPDAASQLTKDSTLEAKKLSSNRAIALGFLRSYALLNQHRSDFELARKHHLIPEDVDWIKWSSFISCFRHLQDHHVATRYHYGQLHLARLHWLHRLCQPKSVRLGLFYESPYSSSGGYIRRAAVLLLFVFASLSLVLSSMQVILAVPVDALGFDVPGLQAMMRAFWTFAVALLLSSWLIWVVLVIFPVAVYGCEFLRSVRYREKSAAAPGSAA